MWEDREEDEAELARIVVAPSERGGGLGRALVRLLVAEAAGMGFRDIWVRVIPWNAPALACYESAGFIRTTADEESRFNRGQPYEYVWLQETQSPAT